MTTEAEAAEFVKDFIDQGSWGDWGDGPSELMQAYAYDQVTSIDEAGIVTNDEGFVISFEDGTKFVVTVKQIA